MTLVESGDLFRAAERLNVSMDIDRAVRKALAAAIKQSDRSRSQIADEMTRLTGQTITAKMLELFTADSMTGHRFPAAWLAAFTVVTRDSTLLHLVAEQAGYEVIGAEEKMLIEYARSMLRRKQDEETIQHVERRFKGRKH